VNQGPTATLLLEAFGERESGGGGGKKSFSEPKETGRNCFQGGPTGLGEEKLGLCGTRETKRKSNCEKKIEGEKKSKRLRRKRYIYKPFPRGDVKMFYERKKVESPKIPTNFNRDT